MYALMYIFAISSLAFTFHTSHLDYAAAAGAYDNSAPATQAACRTDQVAVLHSSNWVRFPYPGEVLGTLQVSLDATLLITVLARRTATCLCHASSRGSKLLSQCIMPPKPPKPFLGEYLLIHNQQCDQSPMTDLAMMTPPQIAGQFGKPTFSAAGVFTMFAGAISAMIESLGDYYAAARISGAPVPPPDVLARGVTWQGISCVLTGHSHSHTRARARTCTRHPLDGCPSRWAGA